MSNFDFGGGPGPGQTPPPIQLPQSQQQFAQPSAPAPTPTPSTPPPVGRGVTLVGVVSLVVLVVVMVAGAFVGNRVWPVRATIDSAWRGLDGNAGELTATLRGQGFRCSDEGTNKATHFHRLCAKFSDTEKVSIEFSGPLSGEIMHVYIEPQGALTGAGLEAAERAIALSVPDASAQTQVRNLLGAGPGANQEVSGPWGSAGWRAGVFTMARTWSGPTFGTHITGTLATVQANAEQEGYRCTEGGESLQCERIANGATWSFTAHPAPTPGVLNSITFTGRIQDRAQLDPAKELDLVLPASRELNRMKWFVSTTDQTNGSAGFARGVRMTYALTPAEVIIDARTPCRVDGC